MTTPGYRGVYQGSVQDAYFDHPLDGFPGQIAAITNTMSVIGFPAATQIPAGHAVFRGDDISRPANQFGTQPAPFTIQQAPRTIGSGAFTAADFVGIALRSESMPNNENGQPVWREDDIVPVLVSGLIYVATRGVISVYDQIAIYVAAGGTGNPTGTAGAHGRPLGTFDDAGNTIGIAADHLDLPETQARWFQSAPADSVGIIQLGVF